jgi:hypothetical protein
MLERTTITVKVVLEYDSDKVKGPDAPDHQVQQLFLERVPDGYFGRCPLRCATLVGAEIVGGLVDKDGVVQN